MSLRVSYYMSLTHDIQKPHHLATNSAVIGVAAISSGRALFSSKKVDNLFSRHLQKTI